jgi:hypothetical protein
MCHEDEVHHEVAAAAVQGTKATEAALVGAHRGSMTKLRRSWQLVLEIWQQIWQVDQQVHCMVADSAL